MTGPDYILDLSSGRATPGAAAPRSGEPVPADQAPSHRADHRRPWLAVHWRCCETYSRIYRNRDATAYDGRCPRCGRPLHIPVGPGGTHSRFFEAF